MRILGIETSCDETSAAIVEETGDAGRPWALRSNVIASQAPIHRDWGGVVPELASRQHVRDICPVVDRALADAGSSLADLGAVAVTRGPGLVGSLLVGLSFAKALAYRLGIPVVGVHHLAGHLAAAEIADEALVAPYLGLVVSGGHTALYRIEAAGESTLLGETRDDAAGEAFDKVAKLLGLPFPGGPALSKLAESGDPQAFAFPRPMQDEPGYDFSYSGLKTAVALAVAKHGAARHADLAASFEAAATDVLVAKARRAAREEGLERVAVVGGVAANARLRRELAASAARDGFALFLPPLDLCTDNAAMIAAAGAQLLARGVRDTLALTAFSRVALPERPWAQRTP